MSVDTTPKVAIYPNGLVNDQYVDPHWLIFDNVEEKQKYIKKEFMFCYKLFSEHEAALRMDERLRVRERLLRKRVDFAKSQGFSNKNSRPKNYWFKAMDDEKEIA
jgi:hypothetical protein